jgi:mRNA interferase MazF
VLKQGDIVKTDLDPTMGHEQSGYRPVIIINNASHTKVSNMNIVCPITSTNRNSRVHIKLNGTKTTGYVMCGQVKSIDFSARKYKVIETADEDTVWEIVDVVQGLIEL